MNEKIKQQSNLDRRKFKAKLANGNWIHGDFNKNMLGYYGFQWTRFNIRQGSFADIIPETFCQCTGISDSMGNPIYENDIIQIVDGDSFAEYIVRWDSHELIYEVVGKTGGGCSLAFVKYWIEHGDKCIVVGNVFDKEEK